METSEFLVLEWKRVAGHVNDQEHKFLELYVAEIPEGWLAQMGVDTAPVVIRDTTHKLFKARKTKKETAERKPRTKKTSEPKKKEEKDKKIAEAATPVAIEKKAEDKKAEPPKAAEPNPEDKKAEAEKAAEKLADQAIDAIVRRPTPPPRTPAVPPSRTVSRPDMTAPPVKGETVSFEADDPAVKAAIQAAEQRVPVVTRPRPPEPPRPSAVPPPPPAAAMRTVQPTGQSQGMNTVTIPANPSLRSAAAMPVAKAPDPRLHSPVPRPQPAPPPPPAVLMHRQATDNPNVRVTVPSAPGNDEATTCIPVEEYIASAAQPRPLVPPPAGRTDDEDTNPVMPGEDRRTRPVPDREPRFYQPGQGKARREGSVSQDSLKTQLIAVQPPDPPKRGR